LLVKAETIGRHDPTSIPARSLFQGNLTMKRFLAPLAVAALLSTTAVTEQAHAQVSASSFSSGGTAISKASGRGNTRLHASSVATGGGYARSTISGRGTRGGFASGNSRAVSHGGVAISNGRSVANGWGARSHANSRARTVGGYARSDSRAVANGPWADARSNADTRTWGTYGRSSSEAIDDRGYGYAAPAAGGQPTASGLPSGFSGGATASIYQNATPRRVIFRSRTGRRGW
jgi:hypothetical protein